MSRILEWLLGASLVNGARNLRNRWATGLTQPDIRPGAWFCYYLGDFLTAHPEVKSVGSMIVEMSNGEFIWATSTPEWDRDWFESHGWEFPDRWTLYDELPTTGVRMNGII
ncbi:MULTISPECIES: hypothetical protein [Mycobacteroides]|uniref:hypothetical protein n=1 Tax=Mycobacteroides TaxID=670516 RepID=UPI000928887F|nr:MULTISPECIES: hypothetical protein [Mycobacteroides]MBV6360476.1 hypothetical protein [Mycobacteroides chelonae]SHW94358.1 Uncharacterised protein [Mycobacteroides abscessus subsp. abscessus]SKL79425.1 Uncharacterised protein [Mycobacteroides abscessus subsp. abscessus]SKM53892.1 Uncharacterised protein [Mycobacteroides abscessus subsp. abscessus]SLK35051.1 Uncharacterised protein [Mycobacteroides abscessus subsp. abscessus]